MTLNDRIARAPPRTRRFLLLAPVLILLGLALLAMVPGILIHLANGPQYEPEQSVEGLLTYEGR
jgi:hypothetical protein